MRSNNSFKPKLLRSGNGVAEKACHAVTCATQFGLTQALGLFGEIAVDKNQADAASEALMAEATAEQTRQAAHLRAKPVKPSWRAFGLGLMGSGVGIAIGSGSDNGLLFGVLGFVFGMVLAAAIARRQA